MPEDLWGALPQAAEEPSPLSILNEQSELLSEKTDGKLLARVYCLLNDQGTDVAFDLVAEQIGFSRKLLAFEFDAIEYYPVRVLSKLEALDPGDFECADSSEFKGALATILQHDEVRSTISKLLRAVHDNAGLLHDLEPAHAV